MTAIASTVTGFNEFIITGPIAIQDNNLIKVGNLPLGLQLNI